MAPRFGNRLLELLNEILDRAFLRPQLEANGFGRAGTGSGDQKARCILGVGEAVASGEGDAEMAYQDGRFDRSGRPARGPFLEPHPVDGLGAETD